MHLKNRHLVTVAGGVGGIGYFVQGSSPCRVSQGKVVPGEGPDEERF